MLEERVRAKEFKLAEQKKKQDQRERAQLRFDLHDVKLNKALADSKKNQIDRALERELATMAKKGMKEERNFLFEDEMMEKARMSSKTV